MAFPSSPNFSRWRAGLWSGCWIALLAASLGCTSPHPSEVVSEPNPAATPRQPTSDHAVGLSSGQDDSVLDDSVLSDTTPADPSTHEVDASTDPGVEDAAVGKPVAEDSGTEDSGAEEVTIHDRAIDNPAVDNGADQRGDTANAAVNRGQQLPITAKTILGGEDIFLEVAETPTQQAMGLMYRDALPDDRGMVFPMNRPRPVRFWMMNVPVALDMVFVYQGQIQYIAAEVPPCPVSPCPTYGPDNQLVDHVIELRSGRAAELGLQVGDAVEIFPLE